MEDINRTLAVLAEKKINNRWLAEEIGKKQQQSTSGY